MNYLRIALGVIISVVALNAFGGGYYGMSGAKDVPTEWLAGSPFTSYFIPSLFLFVVVGGLCLIAAIAVFRNSTNAFRLSAAAGFLMLGWIAIQVAVIGYVSWLQPAIFLAGSLVLFLTFILRNKTRRLASTR